MSNRRNRAFLLFIFPIAAWADVSGIATVPAGSSLNLATGLVASSGGDLLFTGSQFTPQGAARAIDMGNLQIGGFNLISQATVQANDPGFNALPANFSVTAVQGDVLAVRTLGGYYAKVLVQSISSSSTTLQYLTYGAAATTTPPAITAVQNNYSYLQAGLPNYGIAPSSLFIIKGTNLASATTPVLQTSAGSGIPTTLNGASISVTVNGVTTHPGIYYAIATQIAAVLPAATPAGTGTITVTNGNVTSSAQPILVVQSALGFDTYFGSGTGLGVATDPVSGVLFYYNNSAQPGQTIVLWGSGLGPDTADSDVAFSSSPHAVNVPLTIYIGGIQANIGYQGSSGYPGVNQINVTIPSGVPAGCGVSVVAVSGNIASNMVSIPVNAGGGSCSDPVISGTTPLPTQNTYKFGSLQIGAATSAGKTTGTAGGDFIIVSGAESTNGGGLLSMSNCAMGQSVTGTVSNVTTTYIDAGAITLAGPGGTQPVAEYSTGIYTSVMPTGFIPAAGGSFVFTGTGGTAVGPFTASVNYSNPLVWTNQTITSIDRTQPVIITWTGGDTNGYVLITGTSASPQTQSQPVLGGGFNCYAPVSAGQFTVPPSVLLGMPIGTGALSVENATTPTPFTAPGLDYAYTFAAYYTSIPMSYK